MRKRDTNGRIIRTKNRRNLREPIIEKCIGCEKSVNMFCKAYVCPSRMWANGNCALATHIEIKVKETKKRVGQQKQR